MSLLLACFLSFLAGWLSGVYRFVILLLVAIAFSSIVFDTTECLKYCSGFIDWFYSTQSFMTKPIVLSILLSYVLGQLVSSFFTLYPIKKKKFFENILGVANKQSWPVQLGVLIIVLLSGVTILKPDLWDRIDSLKAGGVEATFGKASISSTTRDALHLSVNDLSKDVTIGTWSSFVETYSNLTECNAGMFWQSSDEKNNQFRAGANTWRKAWQ